MNKKLYATDKGKPWETIETKIRGYYLNLNNPPDREEYDRIKAERNKAGVELFDVIDGEKGVFGQFEKTVTIETKWIFGNQWNTTEARVFNWYESIAPSRSIKRGHYLEITDQMVDLVQNTFKCGYCGAEYYGKHNAGKFCNKCLDSEYLKDSDLFLLRVLPAVNKFGKRKPLTEAEYTILKADYIFAQTRSTKSRAATRRRKEKQSRIEDARKTIKNARIERDGFMWLYKNRINSIIALMSSRSYWLSYKNARAK